MTENNLGLKQADEGLSYTPITLVLMMADTLMSLLILRTKFSDFSDQSHCRSNKYSQLINSNNWGEPERAPH